MHAPILALAAGVLCFACGKIETPPSFTGGLFPGTGGAGKTKSVQAWSWAPSKTIDAGNYDVNNDLSSSCIDSWTSGYTNSRGCMQNPAVAYADNRWFLGFTQNYIPMAPPPAYPWADTMRYGVFAALSSLVDGSFGGLGTGLGLIDTGRGLVPPPTVGGSSSRYVKYATFPNGNVVAVYEIELPAPAAAPITYTSVRVPYSIIYYAGQHVWGVAHQLGTYSVGGGIYPQTDLGRVDIGGTKYYTQFCRPTVATSGNDSAMVTWCEDTGAGAAQVMYSRYASGTWSTARPLVDTVPATAVVNPFYNGVTNGLSSLTGSTPYFSSGDVFRISLYAGSLGSILGVTYYDKWISSVTAINGVPGAAQFAIAYDNSANILVCTTLQNMVTALMSTATTEWWEEIAPTPGETQYLPAVTGSTLSQLGVSMIVDPQCSNSDSTTWNISTYYNRGLKNKFRENPDYATTTDRTNILDDLKRAPASTPTTFTAFSGYGGAGSTRIPSTSQVRWQLSSATDLAGDGYGNYALVRTAVTPYFQDGDISASGVSSAQMLVGHEFLGNSGRWKQRSGTHYPTYNEPELSYVSNGASCGYVSASTSVTRQSCSVRNPKVLMSQNGSGLILFYQNQAVTTSSTIGASTPNRLWWASYSSGTGFSSVANVLDSDTVCQTSSTGNDQSVCETESYESSSARCQVVGEPSTTPVGIVTNPMFSTLTHDVPSIPAAMNRSGQAVIAFHKMANTGTLQSPVCSYIGTWVTTWDPVNGFGDTTQIDDGLGDTMHASVFISEEGRIAVAYEEVVGSTPATAAKYVFVRTLVNGVWSTQQLANSGQTDAADSMMPSVGINDLGEIVVTYTYAATGGTRRQYLYQYYKH